MNYTVLLCLLLGIALSGAVQFTIKNFHGGPIWVGIQGGGGHPFLEGGGFALAQGQERTINSPNNWEGRFWARTYCNVANDNYCLTGDCGRTIECNGRGGAPPATLAEIKLRGDAGLDYYDLSLVDGFNSMAAIYPINGRGDCRPLECKKDLNAQCPNKLRQYYNGQTIGCKSACTKEPSNSRYCCTNEYNTAQTCTGKGWPADMDSAGYFKRMCPDAYSYAYDDHTSLKTCIADKYEIQFG